ncbi:MAG: outer membrane protein assembly factor BamD [Crocinitomicaceae bacterium]|nr:outer membrane protein assembly factor BamD [Crocinitomicaceae bacterium]|tara:strand:- start:18902 stop:19705 length:804 start_codon:yes stop_codon:yes gene_type:complete
MRVYLLIIVAVTAIFSSCKYNRLLKSNDLTKKYEAANRYFEKGKYYKAMPILEELIPVYRGTEKAERLYYIYAYSDYYMKDYILAAHRFNSFVKTFPFSRYTEECQFMGAVCHHKLSPKHSLDQTDTYKAIQQFELFIHQFPESKFVDSSHVLLDDMRLKLEEKSFQISRQYFRTRKYKAAIVSLENTLQRFPDTKHREDIYLLMVKSNYYWAKNSIDSKKQERYSNTKKAYTKFANSFPESKSMKEALMILEKTNENLKEIESKSI